MRKKLMLCVRPGVLEVRANPFLRSNELMSEDLPTFERPKKAISGLPSVTQCRFSNALLTNSAEMILIDNAYCFMLSSTLVQRYRTGSTRTDRAIMLFLPPNTKCYHRDTT